MPQRGLVGSVQRPTTLALQIFILITLETALDSTLRFEACLGWN